ncbi:hypothetical protein ACFQL1_01495 [Halomicroarcula sp. GCM10025709]|nr:hypothetical protein [Halomicroarcula sp. YJ-61-S]
MSDGPLPDGAVGEFANAYDEWHYLVGGVALGFLLGAEYSRRFHRD